MIRNLFVVLIGLLMMGCFGRAPEPIVVAVNTKTATPSPTHTDIPATATSTFMPTASPMETNQAPTATPLTLPSTATPTVTPPPVTQTPTPTETAIPRIIQTREAWLQQLTPTVIATGSVTGTLRPNLQQGWAELVIERAGIVTVLNAEKTLYRTYAPVFSRIDIRQLDLDNDSEPEFITQAYGSGLPGTWHIGIIYYDEDSQTYQQIEPLVESLRVELDLHNIGRPERWEIITRNGHFAWQLGGAGIAEGLAPIQILRFENGVIVDATHEYPNKVAADADRWLTALTAEDAYGGVERQLLGAYMANMLLLGREYEACTEIELMFSRNRFIFSKQDLYSGPTCQSYIDHIQQLLIETNLHH